MKKAAVEIVQGLTGTEEGIKTLSSKADLLCGPLLDLFKCEEVSNKLNADIWLNSKTFKIYAHYFALNICKGIIKASN